MPKPEEEAAESESLQLFFGLSRASFLTLPRVLMEAMPVSWQDKMAELLKQYGEAFPNQPNLSTRVQITDMAGRLIPTPDWIINYRHPNPAAIKTLREGA